MHFYLINYINALHSIPLIRFKKDRHEVFLYISFSLPTFYFIAIQKLPSAVDYEDIDEELEEEPAEPAVPRLNSAAVCRIIIIMPRIPSILTFLLFC